MLKKLLVLLAVVLVTFLTVSAVAADDPGWVSPDVKVHATNVTVTSIGWTEEVDILVGDTHPFNLTFSAPVGVAVSGQAIIQVLGTEDPDDVVLSLQVTSIHWLPLEFDATLTALIDEYHLDASGDQITVALRATFYTPGTYRFAVWFIELGPEE